MNNSQKGELIGTIPDGSVLENAIPITNDIQGNDVHSGDLVLVLRSDGTWRYGVFILNVYKSVLMRIQVEMGWMYKDIPSSHVKLVKQ